MRSGLSLEEAQELVLGATPVLDPETVATTEALGRILAEPVHSTRTLPPADCSAMDGYALRAADLAGASLEAPVELPVVYEVAAGGQSPRELAAGEAARIFTGAPVPPGADTVVRQEDTEQAGDRVRISVAPLRREHVRGAGEDLAEGDRVLEAGGLLRAPEIGLLASLGRSVVAVHQRPRVAILSGGDELVEPDGDIRGGRIVSSNSYTLAAQCREVGAEPVYLGIARDRPEDLEARLRAGLRADCIVSSAGVSVGDHDHVRPVLEKLGCRLHFWGVNIKPGYPVTFGTFDAVGQEGRGRPLVFGLPGNPVSASVTFEQFVRPALRKMLGHRACFRPTLRARLGESLRKKAGRLHLVRVQLERRGREVVATSTGNQSSGVMRSLSLAQGLLVFPSAETALAEGAEVIVQVIDESFFASPTRGFPAD
ncbi:MAG: molybdopterin molybdotransferase MoeA [Deltaproteobacteria bacterium]|nr:molybdopterin molybdotransferase MoeA [Deltaproteobacteria bacterium]